MRTAAFVAAFCVLGVACTPRDTVPAYEASDLVDDACEREMTYLDSLIKERKLDPSFPTAKLLEAIELRQVAAELYLDGQAQLALEFIEEAIFLLEDSRETVQH